MSDGNTAVQVSPIPTEQDMSIFRQVMDNALNSIVQASELAKTVASLKVEVEGFKQDLEILRARNRDLDEMLTHVRSQRDEAERNLSNTRNELAQVQASLKTEQDMVSSMGQEIASLRQQLEDTKRDNSELAEGIRSATNRAEAAEAKLSDIQEFAQRLFPPKAVAASEPSPVQPEGQPLTETQATQSRRVYEGEEGFDWSRPNWFDHTKGRYYNEYAA